MTELERKIQLDVRMLFGKGISHILEACAQAADMLTSDINSQGKKITELDHPFLGFGVDKAGRRSKRSADESTFICIPVVNAVPRHYYIDKVPPAVTMTGYVLERAPELLAQALGDAPNLYPAVLAFYFIPPIRKHLMIHCR